MLHDPKIMCFPVSLSNSLLSGTTIGSNVRRFSQNIDFYILIRSGSTIVKKISNFAKYVTQKFFYEHARMRMKNDDDVSSMTTFVTLAHLSSTSTSNAAAMTTQTSCRVKPQPFHS